MTHLDRSLGNVHGGPSRIQLVIMNLVVNEGDAIPHGGKVTIETKNATLDASYASEHFEVAPGPYACDERHWPASSWTNCN